MDIRRLLAARLSDRSLSLIAIHRPKYRNTAKRTA
jgi:hypothetical protein